MNYSLIWQSSILSKQSFPLSIVRVIWILQYKLNNSFSDFIRGFCSKHWFLDYLYTLIQRSSPWWSRCSLPSLYIPQPTASFCLEVRKLLSSRGATIKVTNKNIKKGQQHKERANKTKEKEFFLVTVISSPLSSHSWSCLSWWHRFSVFNENLRHESQAWQVSDEKCPVTRIFMDFQLQ